MNEKKLPPILEQDIVELVKIAYLEQFAGYERIQTPHGVRWLSGDRSENDLANSLAEISMEQLPEITGTGFALLSALDAYCDNANERAPPGVRLVWSVNKRPDGDCAVALAEALDPTAAGNETAKPQHDVKYVAVANDPAFAIALAMVQSSPANMDQMHRELFPHRYIVT